MTAWSRWAESHHMSRCVSPFMMPHGMTLPLLNKIKSFFVSCVRRNSIHTNAYIYTTFVSTHAQHDCKYLIYSCKYVTSIFHLNLTYKTYAVVINTFCNIAVCSYLLMLRHEIVPGTGCFNLTGIASQWIHWYVETKLVSCVCMHIREIQARGLTRQK